MDDEEPGLTDAEVDPFVETTDWRPCSPAPTVRPDPIAFIDGVQRTELRVLAEDAGETCFGAFASVAVGAVRSSPSASCVEPIRVHRALALAGPMGTGAWLVPCGSAVLAFEPTRSVKQGYLGVADAVDRLRGEAEMQLGQAMVDQGYPLVILDGRLRLFPTPGTAVIGYTKTIHRRYLARPQEAMLPELGAGQRSPLFLIQEQRPLYSWYLRLAAGRPIEHALAGMVRLETSASIGVTEAINLANLTAHHLPSFASTQERDPRAPQNLLPIGALEDRLRHELGDHAWIRRSIEAHLHLEWAA